MLLFFAERSVLGILKVTYSVLIVAASWAQLYER